MKTLPNDLDAAYEWTRAAGELDELKALAARPRKLAAYCRDSAANAAEHGEDISAEDISALAAWLAS